MMIQRSREIIAGRVEAGDDRQVLLVNRTAEPDSQIGENALRLADCGCDRLALLDAGDDKEFRVRQDDVVADLEVLNVHIVWKLDDVRKKEEGQLRIP